MAQGQVRMAGLQSGIDAQITTQKAMQSEVAQLAAPDRVVAQAIGYGLVAPGSVTDLPQVPLNVPLPVPDTAPVNAPAATHPTSTPSHPAATAGTTTSTTPPAR